jgi:outer membrane protein insertion porin family
MRAFIRVAVGLLGVGCAAWVPPGPPAPAVTVEASPAPGAPPAHEEPPRQTRVIFEGNHDLTSQELLGALDGGSGSRPAFDMGLLRPLLPGHAAFLLGENPTRAELMILGLYYDRGYLAASVDRPDVRSPNDSATTDVRFHVVEGPRFRLAKLAIEERDPDGRVVAPLGHGPLRRLLSLQDGDWFSRRALVGDLAGIRTLYRDAGYANVEADPATDLNVATSPPTVDVTIALRRGPMVTIDQIVITGNDRLSADEIRAIVAIPPGQPFGETRLAQARSRLLATGKLASVEVTTEQVPSPTHVTTTFEVTER